MRNNPDFSNSIGTSLNGRDPSTSEKTEITVAEESEITTSANPTTNIPDSKSNKKRKAGRKRISEDKKKKQMVLTISPDTYHKLIKWAEGKARSAPNYVSDYVEEHIDDIIK